MNERIKELAEQVGAGWGNLDPSWVDLEKFAELIVMECVGFVDNYVSAIDYDTGDELKKHFGIKKCGK